MLSLHLANAEELKWAQTQVIEHHYLHSPVDVRCMPVAYVVTLENDPIGCLIFGRPESTKCNGWYGSVADVRSGKCYLTRWQVLNLARVYLDPSIQRNSERYIPNAASWAIAKALQKVVVDYLVYRPPVYLDEPYEIRECLSYCQSNIHRGTIYKASNFQLRRTNEHGLETYARSLRHLTHEEHARIQEYSLHDKRAQRFRRERNYQQLSWLSA